MALSGVPTVGDSTAIWSRWSHLWAPWVDLLDPTQPPELGNEPDSSAAMSGVWRTLKRDYPDLLEEPLTEDIVYDRDASEELLARVRRAAPNGQTFNATRAVLEVLDAGNDMKRWDVAIPYVPAPMPPSPASNYQATSFADMVHHQPLFDAFIQSLGTDSSELAASIAWDRLLTSAMLFGGLLQPHWLGALPSAVHSAPAHFYWLELDYTVERGKPGMHTRWYPDPLTRYLLICQSKRGWPASPPTVRTAREAFRVVRDYARAFGFGEALPRNGSQLRSIAATRLALFVPGYVLAYLQGQLRSTSVPAEVAERLRERPRTVLATPPKTGRPHVARRAPPGDVEGADEDHVPEQVSSLRAKIGRGRSRSDPERIRVWRAHRAAAGTLLPSVQRLAEWVEWLLRARHGHSAASPRAVYERYTAIDERLVGQLGGVDPAALTAAEDFVELYADAIEDGAEQGKADRVRKGLRSFHRYLTESFSGVPDLVEEGLFETVNGYAPDPNLIGRATFEHAMDVLRHTQRGDRTTADAMVLIASLGYYGGLRRSEAMGLRVRDIEALPDWNVLVEPTGERRLKSHAARRLVPFFSLAPRATIELLERWYEYRQDQPDVEGPTSTARLFDLPGRGPIRENDQLFETITSVLARATHDPHVRFHHLRHTFASALLVTLWEAEHGRPRWRPHGLPELVDVDPAAPTTVSIQPSIKNALIGPGKTQRRSLRAIAMLMGHSGVDVTLGHYVHTLDYVAGLALRSAVPELSRSAIATVTGYSPPQVQAYAREHERQSTADLLERLGDHQVPRVSRMSHPAVDDEPEPDDWAMALPEDVFERLTLMARAINEYDGNIRGQWEKQRYPWSWTEVGDMASSVHREVPSAARKRPKATTQRLIDLPRGDDEWHWAAWTVARVQDWPFNDCHALVWDAVQAHVEGPPLTVRFADLPRLKRWLRLLEALGVADSVDLEHYPQRASKVGSAEIQRAYWALRCDRPVTTVAPPEERSRSRGEIVVRPQRGFADVHGVSSYALQWALTMVYVGVPDLVHNIKAWR